MKGELEERKPNEWRKTNVYFTFIEALNMLCVTLLWGYGNARGCFFYFLCALLMFSDIKTA